MKTSEAKISSTTLPLQKKENQPFFSKDGKGSFFSKSNEFPQSFFGPSIIQPKLTVGQPNDKYEQEADAMADKVVQRLATPDVLTKKETAVQAKPLAAKATPLVQTKCAACEQDENLQKKEKEVVQESPLELKLKPIFESNAEPPDDENNIQRKCEECEQEKKVQKKEWTNQQSTSPDIESSLNSSKGSGSSLHATTRAQMENSFGADFSDVRLHTDSTAVQMNKDLNAQAFTNGNDIYFNSGKYDTGSIGGKHLLAHELTHVLQQGHFIKRKIIQRQQDTQAPAIGVNPPPTSPAQTTIPVTMNCNPQGLSRPDFLSRNGNRVSEFGHTLITADQSMLNPSALTFQQAGRGRRVKPVAITINLPAIESIFTRAGIFIEGSQRVVFDADGDCLTDTYDLQWRISTGGAGKIQEGEQEHCNDYNHAYANSVLPYLTEVNRLAAGTSTFSNERAAKTFIQGRIGFDPDDWFTRFGCLLRQSLQRDRVIRGFTRSSHEPIPFTNAPSRHNRCRFATVSITERSLPQVGQTTSATIIAGC